MNIQEIEKLAGLARIELADKEKEKLLKDIEEILGFVGQIQLATPKDSEGGDVAEARVGIPYNKMRPDGEPHKTGMYTDDLLKEASETKDGYVKVKKIL